MTMKIKNKKLFITLVLLLLMSLCSCSLADRMSADECKVTYTANLIDNDSVGNEWYTALFYDGKHLPPKSVIAYSESLVFYAYAEEDDTVADKKKVRVDFESIKPGETLSKTVTVIVRENAGRYQGNRATWEFTITVKRGK